MWITRNMANKISCFSNNKVQDVSCGDSLLLATGVAQHQNGNRSPTSETLGSTSTFNRLTRSVEQVMIDHGDTKGRTRQIAKFMTVLAVPLLTLLIMLSLKLSGVASNYRRTKDSADVIERFQVIDHLVTLLQVERGTSASFISSQGANYGVHDRLVTARINTDQVAGQLAFENIVFDSNVFSNNETFLEVLTAFRYRIDAGRMEFLECMESYTKMNDVLIAFGISEILLTVQGDVWSLVVASESMLKCSDYIGIERALGAAQFTSCSLDNAAQNWFASIQGSIYAHKKRAFTYHPESEAKWNQTFMGTDLEQQISKMHNYILAQTFEASCKRSTALVRFNNEKRWWDNMTAYIQLWKHIRDDVIAEIHSEMSSIATREKNILISYICIMIIVFIMSTALGVWYSMNFTKLMTRMSSGALKISQQALALRREKRLAEELVHLLLPRTVADQLKLQKAVPAQHFQAVTIYFSDIVGFTSIAALISPMEVVQMLNAIYSVFDASIDRYDVYKVETIGDAYMVASGLPTENTTHAREIALMALELLQSISDLAIPVIPSNKLELRIGLHTGPCVAGVVGTKMPRYCLFGDTVNIASRMETLGKPLMIHVSSTTAALLLNKFTGFKLQERNDLNIKGKCHVTTFWLTGHQPVASGKTVRIDNER